MPSWREHSTDDLSCSPHACVFEVYERKRSCNTCSPSASQMGLSLNDAFNQASATI
jgi:hypothetical protein